MKQEKKQKQKKNKKLNPGNKRKYEIKWERMKMMNERNLEWRNIR